MRSQFVSFAKRFACARWPQILWTFYVSYVICVIVTTRVLLLLMFNLPYCWHLRLLLFLFACCLLVICFCNVCCMLLWLLSLVQTRLRGDETSLARVSPPVSKLYHQLSSSLRSFQILREYITKFLPVFYGYTRGSILWTFQATLACTLVLVWPRHENWQRRLACKLSLRKGRFPFNGLTGQTWIFGRFRLTRPDRSERPNCWMGHKTFGLRTYLTRKCSQNYNEVYFR